MNVFISGFKELYTWDGKLGFHYKASKIVFGN